MARSLPIRLRTIAAAIVVIASGLIIWNAYQSIIGSSDITNATVPVIQADSEPFRRVPENPGGAIIPNQGSTLFNVLNAENSDDMALDGVNISTSNQDEPETILDNTYETSGFALPEIPLKRKESLYGSLDDLEQDSEISDILDDSPMSDTDKSDLKEKLKKAIEKAEDDQELAVVPDTIIEEEITQSEEEVETDEVKTIIKPSRKPDMPRSKPIAKQKTLSMRDILNPSVTKKERYYIQLGSLKGEENARNAYNKIRSDFPQLVEGISVSFPQADLGNRGLFTRIQIGPMEEKEARNRCAKYTSSPRGGTCLVISR